MKPDYAKDLEWYEDGYTMEEQNALKKEYENNVKVLHLTPKYQNEAADKLIKSLTQKLAAAEEYIAELEESKLKEYENRALKAEEKYKAILNKYSKDRQTLLVSDEFYKALKDQVKVLSKEVSDLKSVRDNLIYELNNCKNLLYGSTKNN